jgi:hypothetical protein
MPASAGRGPAFSNGAPITQSKAALKTAANNLFMQGSQTSKIRSQFHSQLLASNSPDN